MFLVLDSYTKRNTGSVALTFLRPIGYRWDKVSQFNGEAQSLEAPFIGRSLDASLGRMITSVAFRS